LSTESKSGSVVLTFLSTVFFGADKKPGTHASFVNVALHSVALLAVTVLS